MRKLSTWFLSLMLVAAFVFGAVAVMAADAPALPTANVSEIENEELTFALNFKAAQVNAEQLAYYGDWYADFELTVNKDITLYTEEGADGYLSGQYDAWSENWVNVPFNKAVSLKAGETVKVMAFAAELMGKPGLKYTYKEVYESVKDFDCGMFLTEEYMQANPDLEVTLGLYAYNNEDEAERYLIGRSYTFCLGYVAQNVQTDVMYDDVSDAMQAAADGQTVRLLKDADELVLTVKENTTLDLNGHELAVTYASVFGFMEDNSAENTGVLKVADTKLLINSENTQLPVKTEEGYRFVEVIGFNTAWMNENTFVFQPLFEKAGNELLKNGVANTGVSIQVEVTWKPAAGSEDLDSRTFKYGDTLVNDFIGSYNASTGKYGRMFTLALVNPDNYVDLSCHSKVVSTTRVEFAPQQGNAYVTEEVQLTNEQASAVVPVGTKLKDANAALTLNTTEMDKTTTDVVLTDGETMLSMDVHVDGVAADNTVPVIVTLNEITMNGLNEGNIALYHVENGETVKMTRVYTIEEVDEHNEYYYDIATGTITMALKSFSEVAVVADEVNGWNGTIADGFNGGSGTEADPYIIANADQLAYFGKAVGGMGEDFAPNSFAGKYIKLTSDINLADDEKNNDPKKIFYPIGYYSSDEKYEKTGVAITSGLKNFEGTFDGNGHTVSNFYQNTWEMKGDHDWYDATLQYYRDGMGLFGRVYKGTIKNLTIKNFSSDGEIATTGCIAAYADGATFENIAIFNCNPRVYNIGNGGIVGCVGWYAKEADLETTFKNITVDNSNKISALWGSYDVACGGLVGQYYPTSGQSSYDYPENAGIHMENCHVSAQMDVYNDVCANYQYYAYRYTGMLIGSVRENVTIDGKSYPQMEGITAKDCTVHFGDWNDYYYCELVANSLASYTHDHQFSRLEQVASVNGTTITSLKGEEFTVPASGRYNYVVVNGEHATENATCYHFVDGKVHNHDDYNGDGVEDYETVNGESIRVENNRHIYLEFNNIVTGYGWGVTSKGLTDFKGVEILDITEGEHEKSVVKFEAVNATTEFEFGSVVSIGKLFTAKENSGVDIDVDNVQVTVSPVGEGSTAGGTYVPYTKIDGATDWTEGTLTFSGTGAATITITDYYFCTPTTITVTVKERQSVEKFETKFTGDFLYRVGNKNTVTLGNLFKAKDGATIGTVSVTVEAINGTAASGAYTPNTTWTDGTIQFSGTGVVKVTIKDEDTYCTPTELILEVVDAKNITSATSAGNDTTKEQVPNNLVLLNNCGFSSFEILDGYTLYGNGFVMTCSSDSASLSFGQFVDLNNGTLDNVQIVCPNYDFAALYKSQLESDDNRSQTTDRERYYNAKSAVNVSGNSQILNSRISGGRAAIYAASGNIVIDNSRIELGAVANIIVSSANSLTLRDVTLVQMPTESTFKDAEGNSVTLMGMSVLYLCNADGSATPTKLEGSLKQYAWADESCATYMPSGTESIVPTVLAKTNFTHNIDGKLCVNLGFAYMPNEGTKVNEPNNIEDNRKDNTTVIYDYESVSATIPTDLMEVTVNTYVYSYKNTNGTADDFKTVIDYVPNKYSDIVSLIFSDTTEGLNLSKSYGTDGWIFELNVDLDKLAGYSLDFAKLTMSINGVLSDNYMVNGSTKPVTPIEVIAGGCVYDLAIEIDNKTYTATLLVTGVETSKEPPVLIQEVGGSKISTSEVSWADGKCVTRKDDGGSTNYTGAAPVLDGVVIRYWSVSQKKYIDLELKGITPADSQKLNGTNNFWEYTDTNGDYTLKITNTSYVHTGNKIYAMPVVHKGVMYFVSSSENGFVSTGSGAREINIKYEFSDNNGGSLEFEHKWTVAYNSSNPLKYQDMTGIKDGCVTPDTLVTLADGSQVRVDSLTGNEELLVWNMVTGQLDSAPILFVDSDAEAEYEIVHLYFSDGTDVKVIYEHGFWDYDLNKYVYLDENAAAYIGHTFAKQNGDSLEKVTLTDVVIETEITTAWSPVTADHLCYFVNGMLSMPGGVGGLFNIFEVNPETMTYDLEKMQQDIETYGLFTYEELKAYAPSLTEDMFELCGGAYLKISIGKGNMTMDELVAMINRYSKFF